MLVLEDLPATDANKFGSLGHVWVGDEMGLRPYERAELDAETQSDLSKLLDVLRRDTLATLSYKRVAADASGSHSSHDEFSRREKRLNRNAAAQHESSQLAVDVATRLLDDRAPVRLSEIFSPHSLTVAPVEARAAVQ
jgi:hypothetical protein